METTHENSRFRSQLLEKTLVLKSSKVRDLKPQFLPSATATVTTFATIKNLRKLEIQKELLQKTTVLSINKLTKVNLKKSFQKLGVISFTSLLAGCTSPSYANNVKVQQRVNTNNSKVYVRVNSNCKDSSQLEKINQLSFFDSFNCVDKVAVTSNNVLLSQSTSAAPQRQCGFFMSAIQQNGGIAPLCRVYTPKYDTRKGNMGSGTCTPRVKPDTLTISTVSGVSQSSTR